MQINEQVSVRDDDSVKSSAKDQQHCRVQHMHEHEVQIFNKKAAHLSQQRSPTCESHQHFSSYSGTRQISTPKTYAPP